MNGIKYAWNRNPLLQFQATSKDQTIQLEEQTPLRFYLGSKQFQPNGIKLTQPNQNPSNWRLNWQRKSKKIELPLAQNKASVVKHDYKLPKHKTSLKQATHCLVTLRTSYFHQELLNLSENWRINQVGKTELGFCGENEEMWQPKHFTKL